MFFSIKETIKDFSTYMTLNKTSRNALIDKYNGETSKMLNKRIPVETAKTEKGRAIYVDREELAKI